MQYLHINLCIWHLYVMLHWDIYITWTFYNKVLWGKTFVTTITNSLRSIDWDISCSNRRLTLTEVPSWNIFLYTSGPIILRPSVGLCLRYNYGMTLLIYTNRFNVLIWGHKQAKRFKTFLLNYSHLSLYLCTNFKLKLENDFS